VRAQQDFSLAGVEKQTGARQNMPLTEWGSGDTKCECDDGAIRRLIKEEKKIASNKEQIRSSSLFRDRRAFKQHIRPAARAVLLVNFSWGSNSGCQLEWASKHSVQRVFSVRGEEGQAGARPERDDRSGGGVVARGQSSRHGYT
jgi:hypothetical protein